MSIDIEQLLQEISPEQPCGENLEYDPALQELETLIQGKPETQFGEAEEPDWGQIESKSIELFSRTKDLRVTLYLSLGLLQQDGVPGLRDGLVVMHELLERYWDAVYPQADPDDPEDYLERMNVISSIGVTTFGDPYKFLQRMREAPLCNSRQLGRFSYRDIQAAQGAVSRPEDSDAPAPALSAISAAFQDTDPEELQRTVAALQELSERVVRIDQLVTERAGSSQAPNLSGLKRTVDEISGKVREFLPEGLAAPAGEGEPAGEEGEAPAPQAVQRISGEITSRQDVIAAIDKVCSYYQQCEPGSPVPFLLGWAKRLVQKDFMEIIEDLSPDGLAQFRNIVGVKVDSDEEQE